MNKLGTAIGGLLLVGALAAPVAFAHTDSGNGPDVLSGSFNGPWQTPGQDRPSGWYYTSTNLAFDANGAPIDNPLDPANCSLAPPEVNAACVFASSDIDPNNLDFSTWSGLYDVEVGGFGACFVPGIGPIEDALTATAALNEKLVDGANGLGQVPDGIHNDGGNSAVGHTFGHYDCNGGADDLFNWETAGCDRYNQAFAQDLVSGGDIWIGAQCNWGVPVAGGSPAPLANRVAQFANDVINCPLGGFHQSCIDAVQYLDDCIGFDLITQTQLPSATPNCGGTQTVSIVCGAGSQSTIDFGYGDGAGGLGSGLGSSDTSTTVDQAIYPDAGFAGSPLASCDDVATATAFPFTQIVITVAGGASSVDVLNPATVGWIA